MFCELLTILLFLLKNIISLANLSECAFVPLKLQKQRIGPYTLESITMMFGMGHGLFWMGGMSEISPKCLQPAL